MTEGVRGARSGQPSPALRTGCVAVLVTTAAFAGVASLGSLITAAPSVDPLAAGAVGFIGSGSILAVRFLRSRKSAAPPAAGLARSTPARPADSKPSASATNDRMMVVTIADLVEAVSTARIARIIVPFGADGSAAEAIALARRLSAKRASTVFVDFGANDVAQEIGLIDAPADVEALAVSPASFAHSIHRDRSSGTHVIAADLGGSERMKPRVSEATGTVLAALGEAYARTVVAIPAQRFAEMPELIADDTAIVVPESSVDDGAIRSLLADLSKQGIDDVVLVSPETEAKRLAAA